MAVYQKYQKPSRFTKLTVLAVLAVLTVRPRRLWRYVPDGLAVVAVRSGGFGGLGGLGGLPPTFTKNGRCWRKPGKHLNPQQANTEAAASTPNAAPLRLVAHLDGCVPDASHSPTSILPNHVLICWNQAGHLTTKSHNYNVIKKLTRTGFANCFLKCFSQS